MLGAIPKLSGCTGTVTALSRRKELPQTTTKLWSYSWRFEDIKGEGESKGSIDTAVIVAEVILK